MCEPATLAEPISAPVESHRIDVIVCGSLNLDLVGRLDRLPVPGETVIGLSYEEHAGGKGLNQAVAVARAGSQVRMMGSLGNDSAGAALREVLHAEGIDERWVTTTADLSTGRAMVWVDAEAENSIVVIPGANHCPADEGLEGVFLGGARVALAQLEVPIDAVTAFMAAARNLGCLTILNPAPATALPEELLHNCEILIPNEGELSALGGAVRLHQLGVRVVLETLGAAGVRCSVADPATSEPIANWTEPALKVSPTDTTGAGDVFCGYFAAAIAERLAQDPVGHQAVTLELEDIRSAVRLAVAAAAIAVTRRGAVPSIPHRAEVDQLLSSLR